ncbi:granzyme B-like isoform X2 [Colossoma macropomum]|uniref:granzyme B-like isoform X2 n=1 Tax=Colossoma macropomum TaxID=42526 RepID=UPI001863C949|nr:granzyme B-like isoform X2 [Colossoma macropomum]
MSEEMNSRVGKCRGGTMESAIIGGKEAKPHSRPYMVSFQVNKEHKCGGMLITKNYVLTSAHCLNGYESSGKKHLEVLLGAHNISRKESSQQRIKVEKYIKHPSYKEAQNDRSYDIMLLKLKTKAKMNKYVDVIVLPKKNETIPANQKCSIAGWGIKVPGKHQASNVLQEVTLKVQFNFECKNLWKDYFDSMRMICTASDGKRAFCQGDSGSPLICNHEPKGIAAYTYPDDCLNRKFPEIYIKVAYFLPWIKKVIQSN